MYTRETIVSVQSYTLQLEDGEAIIGRAEVGVFLAVPQEAIEVLEHLAQGKSVGEATDLYQLKHGEIPDLNDFLTLMERNGIVKHLNANQEAKATDESNAVKLSAKRYHFASFPQTWAKHIFSWPMLIVCFALVTVSLLLLGLKPWLAPRPDDLYFPDHRTLSWTILIVLVYVTLFIHELGHLIAARALGINSRMGISNRLWYLVAETDLTGLWAVPREKRYLPFMAGILVDATSGAMIVIFLFIQDHYGIVFQVLWIRILRAILFTYAMRILWQCFLFIRTDLYYVIANFFGCRNLMHDTQTFIRNQLSRIFTKLRSIDQSEIPVSEYRIIRAYAVLWVTGRITAFILFVSITIPVASGYIRNLATTFKVGFAANPANFIDAALLASYFLVPLGIGFALWIISIIHRERT